MDRNEANLKPAQFAIRGASILATSMGALAFIVITFLSATWESVSPDKQRFAFTVINACGAHFIFSLAFGLPSVLICRKFAKRWSLAVSSVLGGCLYIYCALILQHAGLADCLLPEQWVSVFPFGREMVGLSRGPTHEMLFYALPLLLAWIVAIITGPLFWFGESIFLRKKQRRFA